MRYVRLLQTRGSRGGKDRIAPDLFYGGVYAATRSLIEKALFVAEGPCGPAFWPSGIAEAAAIGAAAALRFNGV